MKWEYYIISLKSIWELGDKSKAPFREIDGFNKLGQEGWELVSVDNGIAYFKRISKQDAIEAEKFMQELTYSAIVGLMKSDR